MHKKRVSGDVVEQSIFHAGNAAFQPRNSGQGFRRVRLRLLCGLRACVPRGPLARLNVNFCVLRVVDQSGNGRVIVPHRRGVHVNIAVVRVGVQGGKVCLFLKLRGVRRLRRVVVCKVLFRGRYHVRVNDERDRARVGNFDVHSQFNFPGGSAGDNNLFRVRRIANGDHVRLFRVVEHAHFPDSPAAHVGGDHRHHVNHVRGFLVDLHAVYLSAPFLAL